MAINLVSSIIQAVSPEMVAKISAMFGLNPAIVQKAIAIGVPAILGSFTNLAASPDGAGQLSAAVSRQSGTVDQFDGAGPSDLRNVSDHGMDMLSGLLGRNGASMLASAVGASTGIDVGAGKSLLGLLAPVVAGVLGQQQKASGLDANGLASLLTTQKDAIAAALPQGLASQLGGLFDGAGAQLRGAAGTASSAAAQVGRMSNDSLAGASQAAHAAAKGSTSWLPYALAGLVVLVGIGWFMMSESPQVAQDQVAPDVARDSATEPTAHSTVGAAPANVSAAELTDQVDSVVGGVRSSLQAVTDANSAQAVVPKLQQATGQLDRLNTLAAQLSPAARQQLAGAVNTAKPALDQLCDRILAIPGVAVVAKPTIDALRAKLDAMAQA